MKRMRRAKEDLGLIIGGEGRRLTCRQNDAFPSDHNWHLFCYRHSTAIQSILSYRCQFVSNLSEKGFFGWLQNTYILDHNFLHNLDDDHHYSHEVDH